MFKAFTLAAVVGLWALSSSGCVFLAAGAAAGGTAVWYSQKVSQEIDRPRDKVVESVKNTLRRLNLNVYKQTNTKEVTQLLSNYTDGRKVWIDVRPVDKTRSRVDLRVGWVNGTEEANTLLGEVIQDAKGWM